MVTGHCVSLDVNRFRRTMHVSFKMMHDLTHEHFVESGIAIEHPKVEMFNNDGKIFDENAMWLDSQI